MKVPSSPHNVCPGHQQDSCTHAEPRQIWATCNKSSASQPRIDLKWIEWLRWSTTQVPSCLNHGGFKQTTTRQFASWEYGELEWMNPLIFMGNRCLMIYTNSENSLRIPQDAMKVPMESLWIFPTCRVQWSSANRTMSLVSQPSLWGRNKGTWPGPRMTQVFQHRYNIIHVP